MRVFFSASVVFLFFFSSCESDSDNVIPADEAPSQSKQTTSDTWMNGGEDLKSGKISEWRHATPDQKLATSAHYLKRSDSVPSADLLRQHAKGLVRCINESVDGMATMSDDPIAEVAAACLSSMGYLNDDDPERLKE